MPRRSGRLPSDQHFPASPSASSGGSSIKRQEPHGFPGSGPSVTERLQRMPPGVSAAIVARRDQWLRVDAVGDLFPSSWMDSDVPAGVASSAASMSMPCPVPGGIVVPIRWRLWVCVPSGRTPPGKPGQGGRAFRGGAKRGGSNERTGGVARRRTILAKTTGCANCPAMKGRLP